MASFSVEPNAVGDSHDIEMLRSHESMSLFAESELELTSEQQQTLIGFWDDAFALYRHTKEQFVSTAMHRRRIRVQQQMAAHTESADSDSEHKTDETTNDTDPDFTTDPAPAATNDTDHDTASDSADDDPASDSESSGRQPVSEWLYLALCVAHLLSLNDQNVSYHLLAIQIYQSHPLPATPKAAEYMERALSSCDCGIRLCLLHLDGHHNSFYLWITTFYVLRAQILFQQRKWQQVIDKILPALKYQNSTNIHLLYNLRASAYCELKQFDNAISDYGLAIEKADEPSSYHNSRGTCWHELGKYETALSDYNLAIEWNAQCVSAYNNRASLFVDMGQYQRALDDANTGLVIYENHGNLYKHRAVAHFHLRHFGECLVDLQKSIRFAPSYRPARVTLKVLWDFYYGHLVELIQPDVCWIVVDFVVGDNYHTDENMVDATYADWKKEMALVEEERRRLRDGDRVQAVGAEGTRRPDGGAMDIDSDSATANVFERDIE